MARHEHYDRVDHPAHGWSIYLIDQGIIKQRLPGRYEHREEATELAASYTQRFDLDPRQRYEVLPFDEDTPR